MRTIHEISDAVRRGERITTDDAITLWREAPLWLLGELAVERKRKASGEMVYYNRNIHIEPSNICLFNCQFCSFRRREGDADAWFMTVDEVVARAEEMQDSDITEIHIVGGVHPSHTLDSYCEMIRRVKEVLPHVAVKAYTAVELFYMIRKADVTVVEGLRRLTEAGMDSIPGGGAEIFDEELRKRICPDKCSSDEWLAVHRAAHHMGIHTNCTMLYGHIESIEQRVDHLNRLRELQDYAPGFDAFIPLKYRSRNNRMSEIGECSVEDDLRTIAMSRIFLDNITHIKAYWVAYGKAVTEMALAFGADDIDGTIDDSTKIYSMAGGDERPTMSVAELEALVRDAGFTPVERDTLYNVVERDESGAIKGISKAAAVVGVAGAVVGSVAEVAANLTTGAVTEAAETIAEATIEATEQTVDTIASTPNEEATDNQVEAIATADVTEESERGNSADDNSAEESVTNEAVEENNEMAKKKKNRFIDGLKRFWQGTKRAYKRFPILFHLLFITIFLLLCVVMLHFGLMWGTRHGDEIVLPDFTGMTIDEARVVAQKCELELVIREVVENEDLAPGYITDQDPSLDDMRTVKVKPGRRIYLTIVSEEREAVAVPYVARQGLSQALQQVYANGFIIDSLVYELTDNFENQVLKQRVNSREITDSTEVTLPRGSGISLVVTYTEDNNSVVVPSVVGLSLNEARRKLWAMGLNVGEINYDRVTNKRDRRQSRICIQDVGAERRVPYGKFVSLYLSDDTELIDSMIVQTANDAKINRKWSEAEQVFLRAKADIEADIERLRIEEEEASRDEQTFNSDNSIVDILRNSVDDLGISLPTVDYSDEDDFFNF